MSTRLLLGMITPCSLRETPPKNVKEKYTKQLISRVTLKVYRNSISKCDQEF